MPTESRISYTTSCSVACDARLKATPIPRIKASDGERFEETVRRVIIYPCAVCGTDTLRGRLVRH